MSENELGLGRETERVHLDFVGDCRGQCDFPLTQTNSFKSRAINYAKCQLVGTGGCFDSEIQ